MSKMVSLKLNGKDLGIRANAEHPLVSAFARIPPYKPPSAGILYVQEGTLGKPVKTLRPFSSPDGSLYQFSEKVDFLNCINLDGEPVYSDGEYLFANEVRLPSGGLFISGISVGTIKGVSDHLTLAERIATFWEIWSIGERDGLATLRYHLDIGKLFEQKGLDADIGSLIIRICVNGLNGPQNPLFLAPEEAKMIQPGVVPLSQISILERDEAISVMKEQGTPNGIIEAATEIFSHPVAKSIADAFNSLMREKLQSYRQMALSDRRVWDPEGLVRKIDSYLARPEIGIFKSYSELTKTVHEADREIKGWNQFTHKTG